MWRSRLAWMVAVAALAFAASASATVSVSLTTSCYFGNLCEPGSVVQLTARVTADAGELDNAVFGAINQPIGQAFGSGSSQTVLPGAGWTTNPLLCTTVFCSVFNQVNSNGPSAVGVTDFPIGSVSFVINGSLGAGTVINFRWRTSPTTQRLDWFGVTNAAGTSVTVVPGLSSPEPATGALLAMGLAGLALAARRQT